MIRNELKNIIIQCVIYHINLKSPAQVGFSLTSNLCLLTYNIVNAFTMLLPYAPIDTLLNKMIY